MKRSKGNSLAQTRKLNRICIKKTIFRNDVITRSEISDLLELTLPTITNNINEMLKDGILKEDRIQSSGQNTLGRKPGAITFNPDFACSIGVELGPYSTTLVLTDCKGSILKTKIIEKAENHYENMLFSLTKHIQELLPEKKKILGIGIGVPGFIDRYSGTIRSNLREGWTGRNLANDLKERLELPVFIDNNVRLRALGYDMALKKSDYDTFAYFYMSKGIACPLVIKNDVFSGSTSGAGEIGENIIMIDEHGKQKKKNVDDLGSEEAIFKKCNLLLKKGEILNHRLKVPKKFTSIDEVLRFQENGVAKIDRIVTEAIEYMGIALSQVVNLINPKLVVVDSCLLGREENRVRFKEAATKYFFGLNEDEVNLVFAKYEETRGARGAAFYIIKELLLESEL